MNNVQTNDVIKRCITELTKRSIMDVGQARQKLDEVLSGNLEEALLRKHYWKLKHANEEILSENQDNLTSTKQPVTCFLYPDLTPNKLRDHLIKKGASDACIVEWMRKLQDIRQHPNEMEHDQSSYGVELLGNN